MGAAGLACSRVTRDEGADVYICARCGERESLAGRAVPLVDWPISVDDLVAEERGLIERFRSSEIALIPVDELRNEGDD
jgi:hypothetical protein